MTVYSFGFVGTSASMRYSVFHVCASLGRGTISSLDPPSVTCLMAGIMLTVLTWGDGFGLRLRRIVFPWAIIKDRW